MYTAPSRPGPAPLPTSEINAVAPSRERSWIIEDSNQDMSLSRLSPAERHLTVEPGCPSERPHGCLSYRTPRRRQGVSQSTMRSTIPASGLVKDRSQQATARPEARRSARACRPSPIKRVPRPSLVRRRCWRACPAWACCTAVGRPFAEPADRAAADDSVQAVLAVQGSVTQLYIQEEVQGDRDARTPGTAAISIKPSVCS